MNRKRSNRIVWGAATVESAMGASIELSSSPAAKAISSGIRGWAVRGAGWLSGPLPLALRLLSLKRNPRNHALRRAAAISSLAGSLLTRWTWVHAGKLSAASPSIPLRRPSSASLE